MSRRARALNDLHPRRGGPNVTAPSANNEVTGEIAEQAGKPRLASELVVGDKLYCIGQ